MIYPFVYEGIAPFSLHSCVQVLKTCSDIEHSICSFPGIQAGIWTVQQSQRLNPQEPHERGEGGPHA